MTVPSIAYDWETDTDKEKSLVNAINKAFLVRLFSKLTFSQFTRFTHTHTHTCIYTHTLIPCLHQYFQGSINKLVGEINV